MIKVESIDISEKIMGKWQSVIDIVARIMEISAALIMRVVEPDISVFLSSKSENNPYHPGDKESLLGSGLYCETVINTQNQLLVPDAHADKDWKNNPDVKLNMISYLGFPLTYPGGETFGTICVLDKKENAYTEDYVNLLKSFRGIINNDLELLYMNFILGEENKQVFDYLSEIQTLRGIIPICAKCKKVKDDKGYWKQIEEYVSSHSGAKFSHGLCESCSKEMYGKDEWYKEMRGKGEGARG